MLISGCNDCPSDGKCFPLITKSGWPAEAQISKTSEIKQQQSHPKFKDIWKKKYRLAKQKKNSRLYVCCLLQAKWRHLDDRCLDQDLKSQRILYNPFLPLSSSTQSVLVSFDRIFSIHIQLLSSLTSLDIIPRFWDFAFCALQSHT